MVTFEPITKYKHRYQDIFKDIANGTLDEAAVYRTLILGDLWFLVYFVMGVEGANHPFVVQYCREVEEGPKDYTLDLAAREHFKTTIITKAETIQRILRNPEERVGIFSHTRPNAKAFLRSIKLIFETNATLKRCFPDVLYENPEKESPKWSEDDGLIVRRKGYYNEGTLEAWGLLEGMPTGKHFTHRVYDDVETADLVNNPETVKRLKDMFDLSQNLGVMRTGTHRVVGTPYHHAALLSYIRDLKVEETPVYYLRLKPATEDGTPNGKPVLISQEELDRKKINEYSFNCQQLLNPTPIGDIRLNSHFLKEINPEFIPASVYKFMVIDPAGNSQDGKGDSWAVHVIGVDPDMDNAGASNIYITDSLISPMVDSEAIEAIVRMYLNGGMIMKVGIEKAGLSSVEVHVANALKARGRHISRDNGTLQILTPAGRKKHIRIARALEWPLNNGKIHISKSVNVAYRERLRAEMDKYPFWHDDGIDALSYLYDMISGYTFPKIPTLKIRYKEMGVV